MPAIRGDKPGGDGAAARMSSYSTATPCALPAIPNTLSAHRAQLRYTKSGTGARLALLLHHDDQNREFVYDRDFKLSPLSEALDHASIYGIDIVSMKNDWRTVFGNA